MAAFICYLGVVEPSACSILEKVPKNFTVLELSDQISYQVIVVVEFALCKFEHLVSISLDLVLCQIHHAQRDKMIQAAQLHL